MPWHFATSLRWRGSEGLCVKSMHNLTGDTSVVQRATTDLMTCVDTSERNFSSTSRSQVQAYHRSPEPHWGPELPADVSVMEIEMHLDRLAIAIVESPHGQEYIPLFDWLEYQLVRKRQLLATMRAVTDRVRRLRDRTEAPS